MISIVFLIIMCVCGVIVMDLVKGHKRRIEDRRKTAVIELTSTENKIMEDIAMLKKSMSSTMCDERKILTLCEYNTLLGEVRTSRHYISNIVIDEESYRYIKTEISSLNAMYQELHNGLFVIKMKI